jgi:glycosyltransferase involved in cell wall biosynthesis
MVEPRVRARFCSGREPGLHRQLAAAAILRLLREPDLAARLKTEGLRDYQARFTPDVMARRHEALFTELLAGRRHGTRRRPR